MTSRDRTTLTRPGHGDTTVTQSTQSLFQHYHVMAGHDKPGQDYPNQAWTWWHYSNAKHPVLIPTLSLMMAEHDKHWDIEDDPEHTWTWWLNMTNTGTWKMTLNIHEHGDWIWQTLGHRRWLNIHEHGDWTWQTLGHGRWPWTYMNMVIEHDKHWDIEDDPEHTWTWWLNMTNTGT